MKRILAFLALSLSLAMNVGFIAVWAIQRYGARRPAQDEPESPGGLGRLRRDIGVTDEQWQEIGPRVVAFEDEVGAIRESLDAAREALIAQVAAPTPDREAIRAHQLAIVEGQRRMQNLVIEHLLREKEALTPAQRQKLFQLLRGRAGHDPMMRGAGEGRQRRRRRGAEAREAP
ncbi:MAG: periplasmic heavy metal sensor [Kiritimatiellae bacterium]|nr:periplasmic heavy metal sensor [Kiritimatiellia bacterium]